MSDIPQIDDLRQALESQDEWVKYPEVKSSGLKWLGEIPKHWNIRRAKFIFKRMNRPIREDDDVVTCFRDGEVTLRSKRRTDGFTFSIKEIGYQGIRKGDLVIHAMDGFAGAIGVSDSDGKSTPVYAVCLPTIPSNTYYYAYLLRHMALSGFISSLAKGIRERSTEFRYSEFKELFLPLPPPNEQDLVVTFVDRETAKIDALIAKKEQLIALLQEQRRAIISHAVTKGLDPDVPMKDSGVEWLGEIPAHWEVKRLKQCIELGTSISYGIVQPGDHVEDGVPFVQTTNMTSGDFHPQSLQRTTRDIAKKYPRSVLQEGDVMLGIRASIGAAHIVDSELVGANLSRGVARIVLDKTIESKFFVTFLGSRQVEDYWHLARQGSTFNEVAIAKVRELYIPIPSLEEQARILWHLQEVSINVDNLINATLETIERLREYRTALISAAVTGKIDVRGEV